MGKDDMPEIRKAIWQSEISAPLITRNEAFRKIREALLNDSSQIAPTGQRSPKKSMQAHAKDAINRKVVSGYIRTEHTHKPANPMNQVTERFIKSTTRGKSSMDADRLTTWLQESLPDGFIGTPRRISQFPHSMGAQFVTEGYNISYFIVPEIDMLRIAIECPNPLPARFYQNACVFLNEMRKRREPIRLVCESDKPLRIEVDHLLGCAVLQNADIDAVRATALQAYRSYRNLFELLNRGAGASGLMELLKDGDPVKVQFPCSRERSEYPDATPSTAQVESIEKWASLSGIGNLAGCANRSEELYGLAGIDTSEPQPIRFEILASECNDTLTCAAYSNVRATRASMTELSKSVSDLMRKQPLPISIIAEPGQPVEFRCTFMPPAKGDLVEILMQLRFCFIDLISAANPILAHAIFTNDKR